jgi:hypothetical protein
MSMLWIPWDARPCIGPFNVHLRGFVSLFPSILVPMDVSLLFLSASAAGFPGTVTVLVTNGAQLDVADRGTHYESTIFVCTVKSFF